MVDINKSDLDHFIKKYRLFKNLTSTYYIHKISLQLINDDELNHFNTLADSINKSITNPFKRKNKYRLVFERTHKDYCQFSKPIFSENGRYALIEFDVESGFMYGSFSGTYLFKKKKGKWIENSHIRGSND